MNRRILVLGSGDIGSAVAHLLFLHGIDVVLADTPAPAHPRRGMAFTDAWFGGRATLDGVVALLVADVEDLVRHLATTETIPCTAAPIDTVANTMRPDALVDARMRKRAVSEDLRALAAVVIGLGPGFTPGCNCTAAIETAWGDDLGMVLPNLPAAALAGEPRALGGAGRERFVYASHDGVWQTDCHIGDRVVEGDLIGTLVGATGITTVRAPLSGSLRGLSHAEVTLRAMQKMVEIDPRPQPECHGLGARPAAIARGVIQALGLPSESPA